MVILAVLALVVSVLALVLGAVAVRRTAVTRRGSGVDALPEDLVGLRQEVATLSAETRDALRHLAVVRYDAFGDMGGQLSWSVALLDDAGNGIVLSSVAGRSQARTYAKPVAGWSSEQQLSPEETDAINAARPS